MAEEPDTKDRQGALTRATLVLERWTSRVADDANPGDGKPLMLISADLPPTVAESLKKSLSKEAGIPEKQILIVDGDNGKKALKISEAAITSAVMEKLEDRDTQNKITKVVAKGLEDEQAKGSKNDDKEKAPESSITTADALNKLNPKIAAAGFEETLNRLEERNRSAGYVATGVKEFTPEQQQAIKDAVMKAGNGNIEKVNFVKDRSGKATVIEMEYKSVAGPAVDLKVLGEELQKNASKFEKVETVQSGKAQAAEAVQSKKTTPAEKVKTGGLVEGATITIASPAVSDKADGKKADLLDYDAKFVITKNKDGKLIAALEGLPWREERRHLAPKPIINGDKVTERATQEITATLTVDGKSKKVTFEVAKDGVLTEKAPAATPQGAAKSAEAQR